MTNMLFLYGFFSLLILALAGSCTLRGCNGGGRMINSSGLSATEKFKLISRWGAQR